MPLGPVTPPVGSAATVVQARLGRIRALDARPARLVIPFDEWEVLYRQRLQLERDALEQREGGTVVASSAVAARRTRPAYMVVAATGIGLIAIDVALILGERRRAKRRR